MFKSELLKLKLQNLLDDIPFKFVKPFNCGNAVKMVLSAMKNNLKIYIRIDEDCDGYMGGLELKYLFDIIGYSNYYIGRIQRKTHKLGLDECRYIIDNGFDMVIIIDSSSNEMNLFNLLSSYGKQVIVLDHHEMDYDYTDYPEGVVVVNPKGEFDVEYREISGTFVGFLFSFWVLHELGFREEKHWAPLYVLGYITIYSDSCDLKNMYNISIIKNIKKYAQYTPPEVKSFMTQWDIMCRNFVLFKFAPRINAQIRTGNFDALHNYLYLGENKIQTIEYNYKYAKEATMILQTSVPVVQYRHFAVANFDQLPEVLRIKYKDIIRNFTGLVANNFMSQYRKPVLVYISEDDAFYGGSVREPFNRDILRLFKSMIDCGGHPQAFGFRLAKNRKDDFFNYLDAMLSKVDYTERTNIVINMDNPSYSNPLTWSLLMAEYNELSGINLPVAYFKKQVSYDMIVDVKEKYTLITWNGMYISCFSDVYYGDKIFIQPVVGKRGVNYIVDLVT